jgi:hypothetical protein
VTCVFRGASRYYDPDYRDGFALECEGVKMVRDEFGLTNLDVMIPFCRTITEAKKVRRDRPSKSERASGSDGSYLSSTHRSSRRWRRTTSSEKTRETIVCVLCVRLQFA